MALRRVVGWSMALAFTLALAASGSAMACTANVTHPGAVENTRGYAFIGALIFRHDRKDETQKLTFRVDRWLTGGRGQYVQLVTDDRCHSIAGFPFGEPIALMTADLRQATGYNSLGWRVQDDGSLRMMTWEGSPELYPWAARMVHSEAELLRLASADLPPTDAAPVAATTGVVPASWWLLASAWMAGALAWLLRHRMRLVSDRPSADRG